MLLLEEFYETVYSKIQSSLGIILLQSFSMSYLSIPYFQQWDGHLLRRQLIL